MDDKKVKMTRWFEKKQKIVVRHLPWNLTEDGFLQIVKENVGEEILSEVAWLHYEKGKLSRMKLVPSFASVVFSKIEYVRRFHEQFDGRSFTDSKGYTSKVTVEFAPNHQIPSTSKQHDDSLLNTIHEDEDFLAWKAQREAPAPPTPKEEALDAWLANKKDEKSKPKATETPLTEAVKDYLWGPNATNRRGGRHRRGLQIKSEKGRGGHKSGGRGGGGVISRGGKDRKRDRDRDNRERDRHDRDKEDRDKEKDKAPLPTKIQVKVKNQPDDMRKPNRQSPESTSSAINNKNNNTSNNINNPIINDNNNNNNNNNNNANINNHNAQSNSAPSRKGGSRSERGGGGNRGGRGGKGVLLSHQSFFLIYMMKNHFFPLMKSVIDYTPK